MPVRLDKCEVPGGPGTVEYLDFTALGGMKKCGGSIVAITLITLALAIPLPGAAQSQDMEDGLAFVTFVQSISAQKGARTCERGIPGYRQQFDDLYARWSAKHRERIARGEALFREALSRKDRRYTDHAKIERIENAIAELAKSPRDSSPITLDDRMLVDCEENLSELEIGLRYPPFGTRHP